MACPLAPHPQPWRTRDAACSPASFLGGVVVIAFGAAAVAIGLRPWVGVAVLGLVVVAAVGAGVVEGRRGHRRSCLVRRALWIGVALPGAPVRLVVNSP